MNFKFKGKFVLRANALTLAFHFEGNPKRYIEDSRSYTNIDVGLVPGPCNPYWGNLENALGASPDDLNSYFTVWEADQPVGIISGGATIPFILRARNGMYIRAAGSGNDKLAATATVPQIEALLLGTSGEWEKGAVLFGLKISPSDPNSAEMLGHVIAQHTFKDQPESRIFLSLSKSVAATEPACSFILKQTPPFLADLQQWKAGQGSDLSWMDWPRVDLSGVQLNDADLTGANLAGANLTGANLSGANLTQTILYRFANLNGANLTGAKMDGTYFVATFENTIFGDNPDFTNAHLGGLITHTDFRRAVLNNTDLNNVQMDHCDLSGLDFTKAARKYLYNARFTNCNLQRANFAGCDLTGANFQDADLTDAILTGLGPGWTRLTDFNFSGAILVGTDFSHSKLLLRNPPVPWGFQSGPVFDPAPKFSQDPNNLTKFVGATLSFKIISLNWSCLDLTDATIVDLPRDLTGLQASHLTAQGIDLSDRNLTNAVFDNADLRNAIFTNANLTGASFKGAKLYGATFSYATLDNADFTGAQLGALDVSGTTIRAAVLSGASMRNAIFTDANLDRCVLNEVQWYGPEAKADSATLPGAKIANANLSGINLKQAKLDNVDFAGTILVNANLSGARALNAAFTDAHLQGAKFENVTLDDADFTNAAVALDHGVPLFGLAADEADGYVRDLDAGRISSDLKTAFQDHGYHLLDNPSVTPNTAGTQWTVANVATTPPPTGLGGMYETFVIFKTESGRLQFYGSTLWVTQEVNGKLQPNNMPCSPTTLPEQAKLSSIVFPSGHKLSEFTNHELTWEQMMTTREPLTPPKCIPSPGAFCPRPHRRA